MKIDDSLSEVFDIAPIVKNEVAVQETVVIDNTDNKIESDYDITRNNLKQLLDKGQEALVHALEVAKQSEHPRAFEVVGGLMKHLSDINHQLLDLHKKKQVLDRPKDDESKEQTNVTNNSIFVGSTADLSKMLDDIRKNK